MILNDLTILYDFHDFISFFISLVEEDDQHHFFLIIVIWITLMTKAKKALEFSSTFKAGGKELPAKLMQERYNFQFYRLSSRFINKNQYHVLRIPAAT